MIQSGSGLGFAAKTFKRLRVTGDLFRQKLEGDDALASKKTISR